MPGSGAAHHLDDGLAAALLHVFDVEVGGRGGARLELLLQVLVGGLEPGQEVVEAPEHCNRGKVGVPCTCML